MLFCLIMKTSIPFTTKLFSSLLLALILLQFSFANKVFCIESDGHTAIETVQLGQCDTSPSTIESTTITDQECSTAHGHEESCQNCTDIPLDQDKISRLDSDNGSIKILSPSYFNLYAGDYKPHYIFSSTEKTPLTFKQLAFVYHPNQVLQTIILII